jgi:3-hydroxybutyrate dehydrogenase
MTLQSRRVLITGGGSGAGADLARGFAAAGAQVIIVGRRRDSLDAVAGTAARITPIVGDVTDEADVLSVFAQAGPIDVVIANAGAGESAPLGRTTLELWQRMLAVNMTGVFLTLREGLRQMEGRDWGRLITIASTAGLKGYAYASAYSAAKHGAVGLTRAVALEVARIANIVETTGRSHTDALKALTRVNPQGRLVQPAEVTAAALWLCGPGSDAINGQAIAIAGGEL